MPLLHGSDGETIEHNVAELIRAGHDPNQAVAIAHDVARRRHDDPPPDVLLHPRMQQTAHLIASHKQIGVDVRRSRIPTQAHPTGIILDYTNALYAVVEETQAELKPLLDAMPGLLEDARAELGALPRHTDAGVVARARVLIQGARSRLAAWSASHRPVAIAERFAVQISAFQRAQLMRQMTAALGVEPILHDRNAQPSIATWIQVNAALIAEMPSVILSGIEKIALRVLSTGRLDAPGRLRYVFPSGETSDQLAKRFAVGRSRAEAIARDQTRSLYAQLNEARQSELGVTKFRWQTMRDSHVRPTHKRREGQVYDWTGRGAPSVLPGEEWGCRCGAIPWVDDTLLEVAKIMRLLPRRGRGR